MNDISSPEFRKFLSRQLRRTSYMWAPRTEALKAAKVAWGKYTCAHCNEIHQKKDIAIDHVDPVCPVTGFAGWDVEIARLFCVVEGFQILCKPCHKIKTTSENAERRIHKAILK